MNGPWKEHKYKFGAIILAFVVIIASIGIYTHFAPRNYPNVSELIIRVPTNVPHGDDLVDSIEDLVDAAQKLGITRLSVLFKQDEDATDELDASGEIIESGRVYFNSSDPQNLNPYNMDIADLFITACHSRGLECYAWIPIFRDHYARHLNPTWGLSGEGDTQYFVNPELEEVQEYQLELLEDLISRYPVDGLRLDYVRNTNVQENETKAAALTNFLEEAASRFEGLPLGVYAFPPNQWWWSGQNYTAWCPFVDSIHPMIYWQDNPTLAGNLRPVLRNTRETTRDSLAHTDQDSTEVIPVISITDWVNTGHTYETFSEKTIRRYFEGIMRQLGDDQIANVSLFYYGAWNTESILNRLEYIQNLQ